MYNKMRYLRMKSIMGSEEREKYTRQGNLCTRVRMIGKKANVKESNTFRSDPLFSGRYFSLLYLHKKGYVRSNFMNLLTICRKERMQHRLIPLIWTAFIGSHSPGADATDLYKNLYGTTDTKTNLHAHRHQISQHRIFFSARAI